ncbi:MAG TPA: efflux RND transporter periplasmic adaptor subunit [Acidobacteriota bacterium]|nr:efflux RND transporter periplasmic adaptor subunit [Acidobacteriota bacterium]
MSKAKKIWIGIGAVVVLAVVVFFSINATRKDEVTVQTAKAERKETLKSKVTASGEIRAKEFVDLQSEIAGVIIDLPVREGDRVKKGQILLKIDPIQSSSDTSAYRAQYEASMADVRSQDISILNAQAQLSRDEAALRSAHSQLSQAESNNARAQSSFKRKQQLNEDGLISREDYEVAQNELKVAKSNLDSAQAQAAQMESGVKISQNNIQQMKSSREATASRAQAQAANLTRVRDIESKTTLMSPLDGVITQLLVEKGERAQPGIMSNPQATLMTIADLSVIQAELKVDETDVINLKIHDPATVKVDALPDSSFEGEVTEIGNSPIGQTQSRQQTSTAQQEAKDFKVIVTLKVPSGKLRPGMSCTGDIITDTKHNVLAVPIQALTIREVEVDKDGKYHEPDLKQKKAQGSVARADNSNEASKDKPKKKELEGVFVINKDKIARFRPVKTGITGESEIEIMDNLKEGEEVVSGSFQTLRTIKDGAAVKIETAGKPGEKKS